MPVIHVRVTEPNARYLAKLGLEQNLSSGKIVAALIDYARKHGLSVEHNEAAQVREPS